MRALLRSLIPVLCLLLLTAPARADFNAGMAAYERGEFEIAMTEWSSLAEAGDAEAQYRVGRLYGFGEGVKQDRKKAFEWYLKAASQQHPTATHNLGVYYKHGFSVQSDPVIAFDYYLNAARLGDITSASIVGGYYSTGEIVTANKEKAAKWFLIAARGGDDSAQNNLGLAYSHGEGVIQDEQAGTYWLERAAAQGHLSAQGALGVRYKFGIGVEKDLVKAYMWHLLSFRPGDWRSYFSLMTGWWATTVEQRKEANRLADAWQPVPENGH